MIIQKIEAIRMPKEISKYLDDSYILLFQCSIHKHILPNGRMQDLFTWTIPLKILWDFFCGKDAISFKMKDYADEIKTYQDGLGRFYDIKRLLKEIDEALQKAQTIDNDSNRFVIGMQNFFTSEVLFDVLCDSSHHEDVYVDRGYYNCNAEMMTKAIEDCFIVKSRNRYLDEKDGRPVLNIRPDSVKEFRTEDEALDFALLHSDSMIEDGYEIIKYKGMPNLYAMKFLREFKMPKVQTFQIT